MESKSETERGENKPKYAGICQSLAKLFQDLDIEVHKELISRVQPVQWNFKNKVNPSTLIVSVKQYRCQMAEKMKKYAYSQLEPPVVEVVTFFKYLWNEGCK